MNASDSQEPPDFDEINVAVAHWHVNAWGGAEYLVTKLAKAVNADCIYTLGDPDPDSSNPHGSVGFNDVTPGLDYSVIRRFQRRGGRLFEYAQWEDIDWRELGDPDVLITSGATTRAVITPDDTFHINYCHSPPRWLYDLYHDRKNSKFGILARPMIRYLRMRDMAVDPRVDHYLVNSPIIKRRLWKYYKRESEVLYPPVELDQYYNKGDHEFFFHLGRLDKEKGVPEVVSAFEKLDQRLVMAGGSGDVDDSVLDQIERAENIEWCGFVDEDEKLDLLAQCTAVVFNGHNEDFGIVPIEANASRKPVLARNDGFPGLFVTEENGRLHDGTVSGIRRTISQFLKQDTLINSDKHISRFSFDAFSANIQDTIEATYADFQDWVRQ